MVEPAVADPQWDAARARWRSAADRLWSMALVDDEGYRRAAGGVGTVLDTLRRTVTTPADLIALEEAPDRVLVGPEGEASPLVVAAACAVRADELDADRARAARAALLAAARAEGRDWVVLAEGLTRSVSVHVATRIALVVVDDPYRDTAPYGLREAVLATDDGDPSAGHDVVEEWFADRAARDAALTRRRAEIASLDGDRPMVSDEG
jgi:hypothetical protein